MEDRTVEMMDDLISRKAAMDVFMGMPPDFYHTSYIVSVINCLPSVDAVPVVHGRWVYEHGDPVLLPCFVCGHQVYRYNNTHYCPNCGARMDGGEDDEAD